MKRKPSHQLTPTLITKLKSIRRDTHWLCVKWLLQTACRFQPFPRLLFFLRGLGELSVEHVHPLDAVPTPPGPLSTTDVQCLAHNQNTAPVTLLLEFCAFGLDYSLLLEHCLSLEQAPALSLVFLPWSQQVRGSSSLSPLCSWELCATHMKWRFSYSRYIIQCVCHRTSLCFFLYDKLACCSLSACVGDRADPSQD